ncbi:hypothetical protein PTSG_03162 [Salpingoeca rosetta]|uniref:Pentacotripeptide-repeat region of PRORP domain-containing protein n=1 Tax=Salpingoeca rosetta (strain ATCC 50818 / BSB-021) TaxID=946362 RepID=F2U4E6_SALR5|nr:uncharacterized protein PTSG_03162 [Salpingoeca rosetta]EGD82512.1 hypothetical protein PTSG_03162 [Salpingoeca rosetta]|eukprot:XP_004995748.1 hypothetical protein PTSG_03162 [Salpingoeca rosetta]
MQDREEQVSHQVRLIAEMETKGLPVEHYRSTFLQQHAERGEPQYFTHYMQAEALAENEEWRRLLLQAYARAPAYTATAALQHLRQSGFEVDRQWTHECIEAYTEAGRPQEASDLLLRLLDYEKKPWTGARRLYTQVISRLCKEGDPISAIEVVHAFLKYNVLINNHTFRLIMDTLATRGKYKEASEFFNAMLATGLVPHRGVYRAFLDAYLAAGELEEAARLVDIMARSGVVDDWEHARVEMYNRVFRGLLANESVKSAKAYALTAPNFRFHMDSHSCKEVVRLYETGALPASTALVLFQTLGAITPDTLASLCDLAQAMSKRVTAPTTTASTATAGTLTAIPATTTTTASATGARATGARAGTTATAGAADIGELDSLLTLIQRIRSFLLTSQRASGGGSSSHANVADAAAATARDAFSRKTDAAVGKDGEAVPTSSPSSSSSSSSSSSQPPAERRGGAPVLEHLGDYTADSLRTAAEHMLDAVGRATTSQGAAALTAATAGSLKVDGSVVDALLAALHMRVQRQEWVEAKALLKDVYAINTDLSEAQRSHLVETLKQARQQWAASKHLLEAASEHSHPHPTPTTGKGAATATTEQVAAATPVTTTATATATETHATPTPPTTVTSSPVSMGKTEDLKAFLTAYDSLVNPQFAMASKELELAAAVKEGSVDGAFAVIAAMKSADLTVSHRHYAQVASLVGNDPEVLLFHFRRLSQRGLSFATTEVDWLVRHLVRHGLLGRALDVPAALPSYRPSHIILRELLVAAATSGSAATPAPAAHSAGSSTSATSTAAVPSPPTTPPPPTPSPTPTTAASLLPAALELYVSGGASFSQAEVEVLADLFKPEALGAVVDIVNKAYALQPTLVDDRAFVTLAERLVEAGLTQHCLSLVDMCHSINVTLPPRVYTLLAHQVLAQHGWSRFTRLQDSMAHVGVYFKREDRQQLRQRAEAAWKKDSSAVHLLSSRADVKGLVQRALDMTLDAGPPHVFCTRAVAEDTCFELIRQRQHTTLAEFVAYMDAQLLPVPDKVMAALLHLAREAKDPATCKWVVTFCHTHGMRIPAASVRLITESLLEHGQRAAAIDYLFYSMDAFPLVCRPAMIQSIVQNVPARTARATLQQVTERALDTNSGKVLNALLDYHIENERPAEAAALFTQVVQQKKHLKHKREYFRTLVSQLLQDGDGQHAHQLLTTLAPLGFNADKDTNLALLSYHSSRGAIGEAEALLQAVAESGHRVKDAMYTTVVLGAVGHRAITRAEELFARMLAEDRTDLLPSMLALARYYMEHGDYDAVNKLAQTHVLLGKVKQRPEEEAQLQRFFEQASQRAGGLSTGGADGAASTYYSDGSDDDEDLLASRTDTSSEGELVGDSASAPGAAAASSYDESDILADGSDDGDLEGLVVATTGATSNSGGSGTGAFDLRHFLSFGDEDPVSDVAGRGHNDHGGEEEVSAVKAPLNSVRDTALEQAQPQPQQHNKRQELTQLHKQPQTTHLQRQSQQKQQQKQQQQQEKQPQGRQQQATSMQGTAASTDTEAADTESSDSPKDVDVAARLRMALARGAHVTLATEEDVDEAMTLLESLAHAGQVQQCLTLRNALLHPLTPAHAPASAGRASAGGVGEGTYDDAAAATRASSAVEPLLCLAFAVADQPTAAREHARRVAQTDEHLGAECLRATIGGCLEANNPWAAYEALQEMVASGVDVRASDFVDVLEVSIEAGNRRNVARVLSLMDTSHVQPNLRVYRLRLDDLLARGDMNALAVVLEEALSHRRFPRRAFTKYIRLVYGADDHEGEEQQRERRLAAAVAGAGKVAAALYAHAPLPRKFEHKDAVRAARVFAMLAEVELAERLVEEMEGRGVETGPAIWNALLRAAARRDGVAGVLASAHAMHAAGQPFDAGSYAAVLSALVSPHASSEESIYPPPLASSQPPHAGPAADSDEEPGWAHKPPHSHQHRRVVAAVARTPGASVEDAQSPESAVSTLCGFLQVLERPLSLSAFHAILESCVQLGQPDLAQATVSAMQARGVRPSVRSCELLMRTHERHGDLRGAERVLESMHSWGLRPPVPLFRRLLQVYAFGGRPEDITRVVELMQSEGIDLNEDSINALVAAYCSSGRPLQAKTVADNLEDAGYTVTHVAYSNLMKAFVRERHFDRAVEAFDRVAESGQPNAYSFHLALVLAEALGDKELDKRARALLAAANMAVDPRLLAALRRQLQGQQQQQQQQQ